VVNTRGQLNQQKHRQQSTISSDSSSPASAHNSKVLTIVNPIQQPTNKLESCQAVVKEEKDLEKEAPSAIER
jgi:hypothetical protein